MIASVANSIHGRIDLVRASISSEDNLRSALEQPR